MATGTGDTGLVLAPCVAGLVRHPLYPRWSNSVYRAAIALAALCAAGLVLGPIFYVRSTYNTSQFMAFDQPVEFDHRHHVRDDGIECLYCHSSAERSPSAGVPPTELCMGCHAQIWNDSPLLEVVRRSYFSGTPINWRRVHDLPDFTYFDHSVHIARGVTCVHCHGDVGAMPRVTKVQSMTMGWCLDCHRAAATTLLPPSVPRNAWEASLDMLTDAPAENLQITQLTTCTACHR